MLDEKFKDVVDVDDFAVEGGAHLGQERVELFLALGQGVLVVLLRRGYLHLEGPVGPLAAPATLEFKVQDVLDLLAVPVRVGVTFVSSH